MVQVRFSRKFSVDKCVSISALLRKPNEDTFRNTLPGYSASRMSYKTFQKMVIDITSYAQKMYFFGALVLSALIVKEIKSSINIPV
mgnify:CR=1 FL=1